MSYATPASLVSNTILSSTYMNTIMGDLNVLGVHNHSGSLGEGSATLNVSSGSISGSLLFRYEPVMSGATATTYYPRVTWYRAGASTGVTTSTFYTCPSGQLPSGGEWGFAGITGSPVMAYDGLRVIYYLALGTYRFDMYYLTSPSGGVITVKDTACVVVGEIDTYSASASVMKFSGSFSNSGCNPITHIMEVSASKNPSSAGCRISSGPISIRWTGS